MMHTDVPSSSAGPQRSATSRIDTGKKMWRVKPKTDEEILNSIEDVETDTILTCDCTCKECKVLYKSYLEAKVSNVTLTDSLVDEKKAMAETIDQIVELEKSHAARLSESARALEAAERKIDMLNKELLAERALRMEEIYRIDFQTKECAAAMTELDTYKKIANKLTIESKSYEFEKQQIQHKLNKMTEAYNEAIRQVKKYESDILHLEEKLDHFRLRVHSSDSSVNQLKIRNENLMAKLNPNYHLKPLKHSSSSNGSGLLTSVDSGSVDLEAILNRDYGSNGGINHQRNASTTSGYNSNVASNYTNNSGSSATKSMLTLSDIASAYRGSSSNGGVGESSGIINANASISGLGYGASSIVGASAPYNLDHLYNGVVNASGFKYQPETTSSGNSNQHKYYKSSTSISGSGSGYYGSSLESDSVVTSSNATRKQKHLKALLPIK